MTGAIPLAKAIIPALNPMQKVHLWLLRACDLVRYKWIVPALNPATFYRSTRS
ncbi:MAG: hypothetical protein NT047_05190 [Deltaproteobacteria bacterium]|nr:hypothetical protein [Deltaproteobacteria bacterium]